MASNFLLVAALVAAVVAYASTEAVSPVPHSFHSGGRIEKLPDYSGPNLTQYSGYITVDDSTGRSIFYWLVKSQSSSAESDPLVLWLQGGPGCSGLGGLSTENGPFRISPNGLEANPYGWTNVANMLWIEAPAGVGFSFKGRDHVSNDTTTAQDNFVFLNRFLEVYPEFNSSELWITGESYGGNYIPRLTYLILSQKSPLQQLLTGFMAGNPVFFCIPEGLSLNDTQVNLYYWHGLVSYSNYYSWQQLGCPQNTSQPACIKLFNTITSQIGVIYQQLKDARRSAGAVGRDNFPSLDPDDLYQDFCTGNGTLDFTNDPSQCQALGDLTQAYFRRSDVQAAIHVNTSQGQTNWTECANVDYQFGTVEQEDMNPYYEQIFKLNPGLHILIYSGDVDIATVPFAQTQFCLHQLNGSRVTDWEPWFVNGATAGYVESFKEYTYATVKGAGHEAPQYQPKSSFNMFKRFLTKQNLTSTVSKHWAPSTVRQGDLLRQSQDGLF